LQTSRDIIETIDQVQSTLSELQKTVDGVLLRAATSRRLEDFVRATTDWVWETDSNHIYSYVSDAIAVVLGVPAQLVTGKYLFSLNYFREVDDTVFRLVAAMDERRPFRNHRLVLTDRLGGQHEILLSGLPVFDETSGHFAGYRGTGVVVPPRHPAESRRRDGPEQRAADVRPEPEPLRTGPEGAPIVEPKVAEERRAPADRASGATPTRPAGADAEPSERGAVGQSERSARHAAEAPDREKADVMAKLSHEIRTPLNAIIGFSEAIKDNSLGPLSEEKMREYVGDIHVASRHLLALVNDILDLSKSESGRVELKEEDIVIEDLVGEAMRMVEIQAKTAGIRVTLNLSPGVPRLRADRRLIRQALLNLLTNAIKYTRPGGSVTVRGYRSPDGGIVLGVSDTGIGMAREDIPMALAPFGRVPTGLEIEGTGLGLPLAVSFVERHGGTVRVNSEKGVGTDVSVTLPPTRSVV
jgi:signal transduction histidine kinase